MYPDLPKLDTLSHLKREELIPLLLKLGLEHNRMMEQLLLVPPNHPNRVFWAEEYIAHLRHSGAKEETIVTAQTDLGLVD